ncbi:MAG TPA: CRISPR-associated endonuclease Cas1 [Pyrinomonadaceae bacterium]|nr:CRISPR-associated endonuclease Cas1 [Pyrinomonadaceae bacterium]
MIRLRLTGAARFHFNHGGALMGLMCRAAGRHELPAGFVPFACESGRVSFREGDPYHVGLTLAGAAPREIDVESLAAGLRRIGSERPDARAPLPTLGGNFEVEGFERLPPPDLEAETARLKSRASLVLRFLSPLRLERPPSLKLKGAGFLNRDCFPPAHFVQRLAKRLFLLEHGRFPEPHECEELARRLNLDCGAEADARGLLWLDVPLEGLPGKREAQPKGYTLGGVVGRVTLGGVPESWHATLVAGQYAHVGEKSHYGLGRYRIEECGGSEAEPFRPARTMLEELRDAAVLQSAFEHVARSSNAPGADGRAPADYAGIEDLFAEQTAAALGGGDYKPAPLLGFVAPKGKGSVRPLAVPTVRDRVVQRAACSVLGPSVETLLEDCSYAYRKGLSRSGAARAVERAYEDGYRYVLDADIESFFDAVEWGRMFAKLEALFPFEPLVSLIKEWLKAPVVFEKSTIKRERGLPQGAPISPLLANLFLDEFDEELLGRDYRLVRYGDDFLVLCRDVEAARRARDDARAKLADMGLKLNEKKTAVRSFDDGFTYLGYLFCRSLVVERKEQEPDAEEALSQETIPAASWLAQVPLERVRSLMQMRNAGGREVVAAVAPGDHRRPEEPSPHPLAPPSTDVELAKRALYVTTAGAQVRRDGETLSVCLPDGEPQAIPVRSLSHVVCYGAVRVTVPVLLALSDAGVPVYFCRRSGRLRTVVGEPSYNWPLWMAQAAAASNEAMRVSFAREIVSAKLHNYAALAGRLRNPRGAEAAEEMRELGRECVNKTTLDALSGLEGRGAALYFRAVREELPAEWGFAGRRTQPPPDPVNAMLSFGYTLLYNHLSTALLAAGLNPRIGIMHGERGTYHALACDLQEEFRHLVDAQVWAMINRREVKPENFYASEDGRYPCLMADDLRRKFIAAFEKRLSSEFTPPEGEAVTYRLFIEAQVRRLKDYLSGRAALYRPLRARGH